MRVLVYLWAALRTLGVLALLYTLLFVTGMIWEAFRSSFLAGCVTLGSLSAVLALFGYQLECVAKERTQRIGTYACLIFGGVAITSLFAALMRPVVVSAIPAITTPIISPVMSYLGFGPVQGVWATNAFFWLFLGPIFIRLLCWRR